MRNTPNHQYSIFRMLRSAGLISYPYSVTFAWTLAFVLAASVLATRPAQAQTYSTLFSFRGTTGSWPVGDLFLDKANNLYGTTLRNGADKTGTVFRLTAANKEKVLYRFTGPDGSNVRSGVTRDAKGNLYGTTAAGGVHNAGVVFELTPNSGGTWNETLLHSFAAPDGAHPMAGVIRDAAGSLYGTTHAGGASRKGTVFKLDPSGVETVLYSFCALANCSDGSFPTAGVIRDGAGNIYGTTYQGGLENECNSNGCGTVFKLDAGGKLRVLYTFTGGADGALPNAVIRDKSGNLYGTTTNGGTGCFSGCGTVFELTRGAHGNWNETVLYNFAAGADGAFPVAGVILDAAGNLYGTTSAGGTSSRGTVFKLDPSGVLTVLHGFSGQDGSSPQGAVIQDSAGNLYGTTRYGGLYNGGVVFKILPQQ